ncbi:MAG: tetratricopeptide repeat protein [Fuerstiella sp.]|nr:tetratricopeptide repeat protein [Fuerstiella sp.]MCP4787606.1 tetratricopeptide repeat protein [Fuerstiella sp.]
MTEAKKAMLRGDVKTATENVEQLLKYDSRNPTALLLAAQLAVDTRSFQDAVDYLTEIPDSGNRTSIDARMLAGDTLLFQLFAIAAAEEQFNRVLAMDPDHADAHNRLAWLLGFSGRTLAANQHTLQIIRLDAFEFVHLAVLSLDHDRIREEKTLRDWTDASPNDPHVLLAQAAFEQTAGNHRNAERLAAKAIRLRPDWGDAVARRGESLLQLEDWPALQKWESSLSQTAKDHPSVWAVRGLKAKAENNLLTAAECFLNALKSEPASRRINYHLGLILRQAGGAGESETYLHRATQMEAYEREAKTAWNTQQVASIEECARLADEIGLDGECYAWCVVAAQHQSSSTWIQQQLRQRFVRLRSLPTDRRLQTSTEVLPNVAGLLSDTTGQNTEPAPDVTTATAFGNAAFREEASAAGLDFSYINGGRPNEGTERLLETLGGGVGVIDYDKDGLPDLYFPQGGSWPIVPAATAASADQMFRNTQGTSFRRTGSVSGIDNNNSFSTGVSVGDYDNDGFPDLYAGKIGSNQLLRNNGDGTFTDVSDCIQGDSNAWSTSSVIADLNHDTFPDIYSVNYLAGDDVLSRVCESNGIPTSCLPQLFQSAQDQLFLGDGRGGFVDATERCGILCDGGNGLAVIAADFEITGKLNLFVANDVAPNFYFRQSPGVGAFAYQEQAVARGLAVNSDAKNEACMGAAAGDVDGNGLLDVFVTNFENETNTLYAQTGSGVFADVTNASGLTNPSRRPLGFGTALLDSDLDGDLDMIVANGHINNYRKSDRPYRMPAQFFLNDGTGNFSQHDAGPYFSVPQLGRGMATLDWNNNGKPDVVVSDLASGAHLLTNDTPSIGNWLKVRLVATGSARDAVGANITIVTSAGTDRYHQTVGAYLSSHDRQTVIGLGAADNVSELSVVWPSGQSTTLVDIKANSSILIQEGRSSAVTLP